MKTTKTTYDAEFFAINDTDLHGEIIRLAPAYSRVIFELAQAKIAKTNATTMLRRARAELELELRAQLSADGEKVTEARVAMMLAVMPSLQALEDEELAAENAYTMAQAVVDSFAKKKDLVVSLAGLARAEIETVRATR